MVCVLVGGTKGGAGLQQGLPLGLLALARGARLVCTRCLTSATRPCHPYAAVGNATYTLSNVETECFNSLKGERFPTDDSSNSNSSGSSSSGGDDGGGTPAWVWAVVGSVLGCAALAAVGAAFVWRRRRRAASAATVAASAAGQDKLAASEEGLGPTPFGSHLAPAKSGSNSDLPSFQSGSALAPWASPGASLEGAKGLAGGKSESGELQSHFLRTR